MDTHIFFSILEGVSWILIWPVMYLIIRFVHHKDRSWRAGDNKSALDVLKERYAKGEIDKKTFEEMKVDIGKN